MLEILADVSKFNAFWRKLKSIQTAFARRRQGKKKVGRQAGCKKQEEAASCHKAARLQEVTIFDPRTRVALLC